MFDVVDGIREESVSCCRGEEDTLVKESTLILDHGAIAQGQCKSSLEAILGDGSRRLLQEALELEVQ